MSAITNKNDGVIIKVRLIPRAKKTESDGLLGDRIKIRLQAPPVDGKANKALITFLAKQLGVPKSRITIVAGSTSRNKTLHITGISTADIKRSSLLP